MASNVVSRRVLMIAYHFPPVQGSSGVQRTLKFSQYLPEFGWDPIVLTVHPRAYERVSDDQMGDIGDTCVVKRAFALDTARHLAVAGRYPRALALPDRWLSWTLPAVASGLSLIRKYRPQAIWSTYPIATAHRIGYRLARTSRKPWVADFRDSMTEKTFPSDPTKWKAYRSIERNTIVHCTKAVFTAPGARKMYEQRYPEIDAGKFSVIQNGYDETNFADVEVVPLQGEPAADEKRPITLVHSGLLYPSERDPTCFFRALRRSIDSGSFAERDVRIVLRASGYEAHYRRQLEEFSLQNVVELAAPLPYSEALSEMLSADGLLLFQASNCNHQIPAKVYEYLRAQRPILAFTDPDGDTASVLKAAGVVSTAPLDDAEQIEALLIRFVRDGNASVASEKSVLESSRYARTRELAFLLDELCE